VTRWVALLRGVNVGGHRRVPMVDLRAGLQGAGLDGVATYLQSGNAVFTGGPDAEADVAALVRSVVRSACGVEAEVVVRTAQELAGLVARLPWPERAADPALLHVLLLSGVPERVDAVHVGGDEQVLVDGRDVWLWYGAGAGRSRLRVEAPGVVATARNWRTVQALAELAGGDNA
jgi:uncharacterized protein (DUF1697 family)